jgi:hypothetical protein
MSSTYPKIPTFWKRDPKTKYKTLLEGEWATHEIGFLANLPWIGTEKVDGMNIRVIWDGQAVRFAGRTDNAQMPEPLLSRLQQLFPVDKMAGEFGYWPITLYGEGYGVKIQKGGGYKPDGQDFILFDAMFDSFKWMQRGALLDIAKRLGCDIVPEVFVGTLDEAAFHAKRGMPSVIAEQRGTMSEGLILKPAVEMFNAVGERVITKIKTSDFRGQ